MIINLTLTEEGPPFWFLGDPKNLLVSLTYQDPGPASVDFSQLTQLECRKICMDIQRGKLECDIPFNKLAAEYDKFFRRDPTTTPEAGSARKKRTGVDKALKIAGVREKQEEKFQKRCKMIAKQSIRALRAALKDEKDMRLLRKVRDLELEKRSPRPTVLDLIELQVQKLQLNVATNIEKNAGSVEIEAESPPKKETFVSDVIESDKEIVQFTPDELEEFAGGKPL